MCTSNESLISRSRSSTCATSLGFHAFGPLVSGEARVSQCAMCSVRLKLSETHMKDLGGRWSGRPFVCMVTEPGRDPCGGVCAAIWVS